MAITPRTIFSRPAFFTLFSLSAIALIAAAGIFIGQHKQTDKLTNCPRYSEAELLALRGPGPKVLPPRPTSCAIFTPENQWSAARWERHLECMEGQKVRSRVLLGEANKAISQVGLTPQLALRKSNYLKAIAPLEQQIEFLRSAVNGLGIVEGELVHRLRRALIWRGQPSDLEEVRELEEILRHLPSAARGAHCERRQTEIWAHMMVAQSLEGTGIEDGSNSIIRSVAHQSVQRAIRTYLGQDCAAQIHEGKRESLAELTGVAIAAEATNGHNGQSSLIRKIAQSYRILNIPEFCRQAVPAGMELRETCEKRVGDEQYLAR